MILWIGDLNYRISDLDVDNVKELISKKEFETLHSYDQVKSPPCWINSLYSSFIFMSGYTYQLHMVLSSSGRSMRRLSLSAL